ncbi:MAG TPA: 23S rRNA (adenine(2503)-C(2))-methyltransferase RlmN, partial [Candidatus Kapabacteria bacterium]|nr:23S rRNA (adenine(2503)-C(2))-methyltransferase RlmN [Candidatus Kapabacteria bacterium]
NGTRNKIMPIAQSFDLSSLMDAVEYYYRQTKMKITYEYIPFDGINDTLEDAERLRKIAQRVPSRVNFIPFNDISFTKPQGISLELKPSPPQRVAQIAEYLRSHKIAVIVRDSFGRDIEAACGQLALSREQ